MSAIAYIAVSALVILVGSLVATIVWIVVTGWRARMQDRGKGWFDDY